MSRVQKDAILTSDYILQVPVFEILPPAFEVKKSSSLEYMAAS
jgi:hypothetical protein